MAEIADILQADKPEGSSQVVLFVPSKNRDGDEIDQDYWVDEGLRIIGQAFRGGTAFPPGRGVWRDDERGSALLFETTVMILSFVNPADLTALVSDSYAAPFRQRSSSGRSISTRANSP